MTHPFSIADRQMAEAAGAEPHQDALVLAREDDFLALAVPTTSQRPEHVRTSRHRDSVVLSWNGSDHGMRWETVQEPLPDEEERVLAWQARMCRIAPAPDEFTTREVRTQGRFGPVYHVSLHPGVTQGEHYAFAHILRDPRWSAANHTLLQTLLGNEYRIVVLQQTRGRWKRPAAQTRERVVAADPSDRTGAWRLEAVGRHDLDEAMEDAEQRDPRRAVRRAERTQKDRVCSMHRSLLEGIDRAALLHLAEQALAFSEDEPGAVSFEVIGWPEDVADGEPFNVKLGIAYDADGRQISNDAADGGVVADQLPVRHRAPLEEGPGGRGPQGLDPHRPGQDPGVGPGELLS